MADNSDDYMSDAFLNVIEDVRPGLVYSSSVKRKYELERKEKEANKRSYIKPHKVLEEERRNEGLDSALTATNKGFSLLQKMGYKPGMAIGRHSSNPSSSGIKEPLKITVKNDRGGLGRDAEIKQKIAEKEARRSEIKIWKEKETENLTKDYRQRMKEKLNLKKIYGDLRACQRACEKLDTQAGINEPEVSWYWFDSSHTGDEDGEVSCNDDDDDDSESEEIELEPSEKLELLVEYLRNTHYYCTWCGTSYNDPNDLSANCPGKQREDHE